MMSTEDIYQKICCWEPDVKKCPDARMQRCKHETVGADLGGHRQVCESSAQKKIRSRLRATEHKTTKPGNTQTALPASQLCSTMPPPEAVKQLVSIMMFVGWPNTGKHLKLRHYDISAEHIFKEEPRESYT